MNQPATSNAPHYSFMYLYNSISMARVATLAMLSFSSFSNWLLLFASVIREFKLTRYSDIDRQTDTLRTCLFVHYKVLLQEKELARQQKVAENREKHRQKRLQ